MLPSLSGSLKRLLLTSLVLFAITFTIILIQVQNENYGSYRLRAILWPLKHALPLLLMTGTCYAALDRSKKRNMTGSRIILIMRIAGSFYSVIVLLILLIQPVVDFSEGETSIQKLEKLDIALYIFQTVLFGILGWWLFMLRKFSKVPQPVVRTKPLVFISYNHGDADYAIEMAKKFDERKIEIIFDRTKMEVGEGINAFIIDSIKRSTATVCIISNKSLMSGYVSKEMMDSFHAQEYGTGKKFIACYVDTEFMNDEFPPNAIKEIDIRLDKTNRRIDELSVLGSDTKKLNADKSRLISLRNSLDDVLEKLNASLCIDIRGQLLHENFPKIFEAIKLNKSTFS